MAYLVAAAGVALLVAGARLLLRKRDDIVSPAALEDIQRREDARAALEDSLGNPNRQKRERPESRERAAPKAYAQPWRHSS
jgi:hypothetical protein